MLVRSAQDVIDALPQPIATEPQHSFDLSPAPPGASRSFQETAALHSDILDRLSPAPVAEDQLIRDLPHARNLIAPSITRLELLGRVRRHAGGLLARVSGD